MSTPVYDCREAANEGEPANLVFASKKVAAAAPHLRFLVLSLSLANLCFLQVWDTALALAGNEQVKYFEMAPPSWGFILSVLANIFGLASFVYFLLYLRRRSSRLRMAISVCLSVICFFALLELERLLVQQLKWSHSDGLEIALAGATVLFGIISIRRAKALMQTLLFVLSPLFPVLTLDAAWLYSRPELKLLRTESVAGKLPLVSSHRRLVWVIFDELDYHMAFEARPARVQMPEFDRLRETSLFAERAQSPASLTTLSMPSLLTGRRVVEVRPRTNNVSLRFEGSSAWHDLHSQPNIFRQARAAGFNTAVAGWHLPYCRIIGEDLSDCASAPNGTDSIAFYTAVSAWPFWPRTFAVGLWEVESLPLERIFFLYTRSFWASGTPQPGRSPVRNGSDLARALYRAANIRNRVVREQQISAAKSILENALRLTQDPNLSFVLIHMPVPHPPGIWNITAKQFTATARSSYVDNLGLTDFLLGQIRASLEKTGAWDQTTLLISADHPFRAKTWQQSTLWTTELASITKGEQSPYVPFLLKLPNQTKPLVYRREFNTVVSGELIWQILHGDVNEPAQAAHWLDIH